MPHIVKKQIIANNRNRLCDDVYGESGNMFFVMDGATPLFDDNVFSSVSDVYDFMQVLRNALEAQISINNEMPLSNILHKAIENACEKLSVPDGMLECEEPNYTVAFTDPQASLGDWVETRSSRLTGDFVRRNDYVIT